MNVLVTGSTGFIGSNLCRELIARGHIVRVFHRAASSLVLLEGLELEHALGDITQPETIQPALEGIEVVFHAAAWMGGGSQSGRLYAVTVEGTRNVLIAARKAGVRRVVHTSSVSALGVPRASDERLLINENHTWNYRPDHYPYGYAKYLAELEVQKAVAGGLDAVIVNPAFVIGAGDLHRQSSSVITQVAERRLSTAVEGGLNCVHIADVTQGHLAALESGRTGERYILGGENLTYLQLLQLIARVTGVPGPNLVLPAGLLHRLTWPAQVLGPFLTLPVSPEMFRLAGYHFFYDLSKAETELGLNVHRSIEEAIAEAHAWFQKA